MVINDHCLGSVTSYSAQWRPLHTKITELIYLYLANLTNTDKLTWDIYSMLLCYLLGKGGFVFGGVGLSVCLFVCLWTTLLKKLGTDWDEILGWGPG